ncbi:MAG: MFS transporter [Streptococcaceae bacterium]|jgi:DHA1 family putative efflux transporter-like MFS transporter|nr:MFS transporter [Streptococcaceae bacterium]
MKFKTIIFLLAIITFLNASSNNIFMGIMDQAAHSLDVSIPLMGQLTTIFALSGAFGTPIVIALIGNWTQKKSLIGAMILVLIGVLLTANAFNFMLLAISRVFIGIGAGVFGISAFAFAARNAPTGKGVKAIATVIMGSSISIIVGVPISRMLISILDWRVLFWFISILSFACLLLLIKILPSQEKDRPIPIKEQLKFLTNPQLLVAFSMTLLMFINVSVMNTYASPFLANVVGMDNQMISMTLFLIGIGSFIGNYLTGAIAGKVAVKKVQPLILFTQAVALILLHIFSANMIMVVVLQMIWICSVWMFIPQQNYQLSLYKPEASSIMMSLNGSALQLGVAMGGVVGGVAIEQATLSVIPLVAAFFAIASGLVTFIAYKKPNFLQAPDFKSGVTIDEATKNGELFDEIQSKTQVENVQ